MEKQNRIVGKGKQNRVVNKGNTDDIRLQTSESNNICYCTLLVYRKEGQ